MIRTKINIIKGQHVDVRLCLFVCVRVCEGVRVFEYVSQYLSVQSFIFRLSFSSPSMSTVQSCNFSYPSTATALTAPTELGDD